MFSSKFPPIKCIATEFDDIVFEDTELIKRLKLRGIFL